MRYQFNVGIGRDKNGAIISVQAADQAREDILSRAANVFGGCTIAYGVGAWKDDAGVIVQERCLIVTVDRLNSGEAMDAVQIKSFAEFCRDLLHQSCVLVSQQESIVRFI